MVDFAYKHPLYPLKEDLYQCQIASEAIALPKALIFDFDFTLADSSKGIVECVSCALRQLGFHIPHPEKIIETVGLSLGETFHCLTNQQDGALTQRFTKCFHQRADEVMDSMTVMYESVDSVLLTIREADIRTAIVTTKLSGRIRSILSANRLQEFFDVIVGADDVKNTKPDPEGLMLALTELGIDAASAVYVGDHIVDAEAAAAAGIPFIATLTGKHQRHAFERYPCYAIVQSIRDVPRMLRLESSP